MALAQDDLQVGVIILTGRQGGREGGREDKKRREDIHSIDIFLFVFIFKNVINVSVSYFLVKQGKAMRPSVRAGIRACGERAGMTMGVRRRPG